MTVTAIRYAEVNSVPLDTYAWYVVDDGYDELMNSPQLRGEDLVMPTATGRRAYPRVVDVMVVSIPLLIVGAFTPDGADISDPVEGMLTHQEYLQANLGLPGTSGVDADRGTVPFVFHRGGSLPAWTAEVTFLGLNDWTTVGHGEALARVDLSVPLGVFVESGS